VLYITLGVGWTQFTDMYSPQSLAKEKCIEYCNYIYSQLQSIPKGFFAGSIDLDAKGLLSKGYEQAQVVSRKYTLEEIDDLSIKRDIDTMINLYDQVSNMVGNTVINIDYSNIASRKKLPEIDKQINRLTLLDEVDKVKIELAKLINDKKPAQIEVIIKKAARNRKIANLYKQSKNYICEICNRKPFTQQNGEPYAEADHVQPLGNGGIDSPDNLRCLCSQCHAVITHGSKTEVDNLLREMK